MRLLFGIFLALCMFTAPAIGQSASAPEVKLYTGLSMDDLADTLLLEGLRFEDVSIDGQGMVANRRFDVSDGVRWTVLGYDCETENGCTELQMHAIFHVAGPEDAMLKLINDWNAANRFTRAYLSHGANAVLEMDIYLRGGQSLKNIREQITIWRQSVRRFSTSMAEDAPTPEGLRTKTPAGVHD